MPDIVAICSHCVLVILNSTQYILTPWYSEVFSAMAISGTLYISVRKKANLKEDEIESLK